ncbi:MAG: methyltransferase domain-containing protein [Deltaproteobacteria bacterium]|nr:methyltransferase domain-containing protein [Deltaproteobacteria bacterium]MBW2069831.1 methyltransferase domain-containing protein [Deltaproteobacteria bacterium]
MNYRHIAMPAQDLEKMLEEIAASAWRPAGLSEVAARRLGRSPVFRAEDEQVILRLILPGLQASPWHVQLCRSMKKRLWDEVYKVVTMRKMLNWLARAGCCLPRDLHFLDIGCGRGGLPVAFLANGFKAVGLDLRYRNCRIAQVRGQRYNLSVPLTVAAAETLPFKTHSFDVISLFGVLEHVDNPVKVLQELHRVCKPSGGCVLTVVNRLAHLDPHYQLWGLNFLPQRLAHLYISRRGREMRSVRDRQTIEDMHYFTYSGFQKLAESVGFRVRDAEEPAQAGRCCLHRLARKTSLGFNQFAVVLLPG